MILYEELSRSASGKIMKLTLLQDLMCPCNKDLALMRVTSTDPQDPTEITNALLRFRTCGEEFPVVRGVRRMPPGLFLSMLPPEYL